MAIPVYRVYPSDVNDAEWALLAPLIPTRKPHGRPRSSDMRRITTGVFSVLRTGLEHGSCARVLRLGIWALSAPRVRSLADRLRVLWAVAS